MTYEELIALAKDGDPLIDPEHPEDAVLTSEGLVIAGRCGPTEYRSDLRILIEPDGLRAWMRDHEGIAKEDILHGPVWTAEAFFEEYDDLVSWAYSF